MRVVTDDPVILRDVAAALRAMPADALALDRKTEEPAHA
jgi:hypothetical protein